MNCGIAYAEAPEDRLSEIWTDDSAGERFYGRLPIDSKKWILKPEPRPPFIFDISPLRLDYLSAQARERAPSLSERFSLLAERWQSETAHISSSSKRIANPAHQEIVSMGYDAVPFLLKDLKESGRSWFWALTAITGVNPIEPVDRGDREKMKKAWLNWGSQKGLI